MARLSDPQKNILIEHIDGPVEIRVNSNRHRVVESLVRMKLLRKANGAEINPRELVLSTAGRMMVCTILAEYAEALVKVGYLDPTPENDAEAMLTRIFKMKDAPKIVPADSAPAEEKA